MAHIRQSRFHAHPTMGLLVKALLDGDQAQAVALARALLAARIQKESIVKEGVEESMSQLDVKCTVEHFNLLEIMLAGRVATEVMKELYPAGTFLPQTKGPIVLGSLEGDIHDLGKNVLKMVLSAKGYRVVDCGKDCPVEKIVSSN